MSQTEKYLAGAFALLSRAAARRKIYARKAAVEGCPEVARFLRAMSESEAVQARRLFNSLIGHIDRTAEYQQTIFADEVQEILDSYSRLITIAAKERPALLTALKQLRSAETGLGSFYSIDQKSVTARKNTSYFVCRFCGFLATDAAPEKCPVCGAPMDAFHEVK